MTTTETEIVDDIVDTTDENLVEEPTETDVEDTVEEPDTFPRKYVEDLRKEAAEYRTKAKDRDTLAERLHTSLVAATGRLADPSDLEFDETHLDDPEALTGAIDDLLERKPHLASRRPVGNIGQGAVGASTDVDLAAILRGRA